MKNKLTLTKVIAALLTVAVVLSMALLVYAEVAPQEGVTVEWVTSQDVYAEGDEVRINLVIANNYNEEKSFTYTVDIPGDIVFDTSAPASGVIPVGIGMEYQLTWVRNGTVSNTPMPDSGSTNDSTNTDDDGAEESDEGANILNIILWALLGLAIIAGIVFVILKRRGAAAMIAIILCAGVVVPMMAPLEINAVEDAASISAVKTITVDGKEIVLKADLTYEDWQAQYTVAEDGVRVYQAEQGRTMFEAEDQVLSGQDRIVTEDHSNASGGKVIRMAKPAEDNDGDLQPDYADYSASLEAQMCFRFVADQDGTYAVWSRMYATSTAISCIVSTNGEQYKYTRMVEVVPEEGDFKWGRVSTVECEAGDVVEIRIRSRHMGGLMDKFIITDNIAYIPSGEGTLPGQLLWDKVTEFDTEEFADPRIYPTEGQHPRVMFTEADIPQILENINHPDNEEARIAFDKRRGTDFDGKLADVEEGSNYNSTYLAVIEAKALDYALYKNSDNEWKKRTALTHGDEAVEAMINFLQTVTFSGTTMDYRYIGATLFTVAEVYDWCYDLLSDHEKDLLVAGAQIQASMIEAGFPPTTVLTQANNSHDAEYQVQQCWLAFAIAVADDYPTIYDYIAGMYFELYIDTRNAWFESTAYHQGSAYGTYRYDADLWGQWLIYQMTGGDNDLDGDGKADGTRVFIDEAAEVAYQWIYSRRPDGKIMTEGDDYEMTQTLDNTWFDSLKSIMFSAANFYEDPVLYQELIRSENPGMYAGGATTIYSPAMMLILNDPSILDDAAGNTEVGNLPLSRYLPEPYGGMIARTGWEFGMTSNDIVVTMQMTQRNMGGHAHNDTGTFQIYYKGLLTGDSGYYVVMGVDHDTNYYGLSVAHNSLSITSKDNPTGIQDHEGNKSAQIEDLLSDDPQYLLSEIVGQEFGPNTYTPDYTYIAADIANAYDDNVQEAIRSMLFLNLELDGNTEYPGVFIVFDQIKTEEIGSKKSFLLHATTRPTMESNVIIIENTEEGYNGKLVNQIMYVGTETAADTKYTISRIGGENKEYWYDGKNHPNESTLADNIAAETGWGRVEVSTTTTTTDQTDYMLNVMYVSDADGSTQVVPATLIKGNGVMGAQIFNHVAMFNMDGNNRIDSTVTFTIPASDEYSTFKVNMAGMKAGTWTVTVNGKSQDCVASEDGGMLYFEVGAGKVTITRKNNNSNKTFDTVDHREPVGDQLFYMVNGNYLITDVKLVKSGDTVLVPVLATFEALQSTITREGSVINIEYVGLQHIVIDTEKKTATVNGKSVDVSGLQVAGDDILLSIEELNLLLTKDFGEAKWIERASCAYVTARAPAYIPEEIRDFNNAIQVEDVFLTDEKGTGLDLSDTSGLVNTLDNSSTSYTALAGYTGEAGAVYDFGKVYTLESIQLMFGQCKTRIYTFEILISMDGVNFTELSGGLRYKSQKAELYTWQEFKLPEDLRTRYIKIVGYGNVPDNSWFNWQEIVFIGVPEQTGEIINSKGTSVYAEAGGTKIGSLTYRAQVKVIRTQVINNVSWARIIWNDDYAWIRMADLAIYADTDARIRDTGKVVADTAVKNSFWADSTKLGTIKKGTAIEILMTEAIDGVTYVLVNYNGYQGWLNLADLALTADPDDFSIEAGTVIADAGATVYNRSSVDSIVMGVLPKGTAVEILQTKDIYGVIYGRIIYEKLDAWINLADVELYDSNPPFYLEIEAEDATLHEGTDSSMYSTEKDGTNKYLTKDVVTVTEDETASGGKVVKLDWGGRFASGTVAQSTDLTGNPAHISFNVNTDRSGTYFVWVRYKCTATTATINSYIDGNLFVNGYATTKTGWLYDVIGDAEDYNSTLVEGGYVWYRLAVCEWKGGETYTIRLRGRDGGISYDKFVVTTDPGFTPSMDEELVEIKTDRTVDAVEVTTDPLRTDIISSETEKDVSLVKLERQHYYDSLYLNTQGLDPSVGFRVVAPTAGTYYVWARFDEFGTLYSSISGYGDDYTYKYYKPDQKMTAEVEGWYLIGKYEVTEAGESIYVRLVGRNGTNVIDQFYVTTDSTFVGTSRCEHSFSKNWTADSDYHWHAATCPHSDLVSGKEEHVYDHDMDATCNTCGYVRSVHPHTYSDEWTSDERYHWHAATCGCTNKISEKAYHTYGEDDRCTVCGAELVYVSDDEMTFIEAEDVDLFLEKDTTFGYGSAPVVIADNTSASGGKVAQWAWTSNSAFGSYTGTGSNDLEAYPAHISFDVKALKTGTHYIWARVSVDSATNIWSYIDGNTYKGNQQAGTGSGWEYDIWGSADYCSTDANDFIWVRVGVCEWTEGKTCSVRFRARNGRQIVFDQFAVTMDNTYAPNMDDSLASFDTDKVIEAEDTTLDMSRVDVVENASSSNEKTVYLNKYVGTATPFLSAQGAPGHINFKVNAATPGRYYIWAKFDSAGTLFASISGSETEHTYAYYELDKKFTPQIDGWYIVGVYETEQANETIYVRLIGRNGATKIDQFYVTADESFVGVKPHVHSFSTEWSTDNDYHWHAGNCGHSDLIADKGEHVYDSEEDATCNTCGYTRQVHVHTYSADWTKDDTHHWHASTCGCATKVSDKAEHTFGADRLCTVCGAELVYVVGKDQTLIEAEDVELFTETDSTYANVVPVTVVTDSSVSGGEYIKLVNNKGAGYTTAYSTDLTAYPAHVSFDVKATETGTYYVWARVKQSGANVWCYIDGITRRTDANVTTAGWTYDGFGNTNGEFVWVKVATCSWEAGNTYSVRYRSRQAGEIQIDQFAVTMGTAEPHVHTYDTTAWGTDKTYHYHACTVEGCLDTCDKAEHDFTTGICPTCGKVSFYTVTGEATYIEAESVNLLTGVDSTCGNCIPVVVDNTVTAASGGAVARWNWAWGTPSNKQSYVTYGELPEVKPAHISFDVKATANVTYYVWVKVSQKSGGNVVICAENDDNRDTGWRYLQFTAAADSNTFVWQKVATCTADADGVYSVSFRARNGGSAYFDQFVVTTDSTFTPS